MIWEPEGLISILHVGKNFFSLCLCYHQRGSSFDDQSHPQNFSVQQFFRQFFLSFFMISEFASMDLDSIKSCILLIGLSRITWTCLNSTQIFSQIQFTHNHQIRHSYPNMHINLNEICDIKFSYRLQTWNCLLDKVLTFLWQRKRCRCCLLPDTLLMLFYFKEKK